MFNRKLKRRIKSLEKALGVDWYDGLEEHKVYFSITDGALHDLYERMKEGSRYHSKNLHILLDYLNLTAVTTPEKTVIEPIKQPFKKGEKDA